MSFRVAINGYGRIGQSLLRSAYQRTDLGFKIHAINELAEIETIAYLTQYDSTHGRFAFPVKVSDDSTLDVGGDQINISSCKTLSQLEWRNDGIDLVFDCTGQISSLEGLSAHLEAGASKVLLSQPGDGSLPKTIVYGVNQKKLSSSDSVVSAASCTSNAVIPVLSVLDEAYGIQSGSITTIHSAMNDQPVIDAYHHSDLRRTRSAMNNIVPVDTGLVKGVERILPQLEDKLSATAIRVPTINVSAIELCVYVTKIVGASEVNTLLKQAAVEDQFCIIKYTEEPLASCDFIQDSHSCVVDGSQTRVSGKHFIKVLIWFDNEWAFANRMLDIAKHWLDLSS